MESSSISILLASLVVELDNAVNVCNGTVLDHGGSGPHVHQERQEPSLALRKPRELDIDINSDELGVDILNMQLHGYGGEVEEAGRVVGPVVAVQGPELDLDRDT